MLEKYFNVLLNDPFTRGSKYMKKFVKLCKYGDKYKRTYSARKYTDVSTNTRSNSNKKVDLPYRINIKDLAK